MSTPDATAGQLPAGAVRWSRQPYIDPVTGAHVVPTGPVPVDANGVLVTEADVVVETRRWVMPWRDLARQVELPARFLYPTGAAAVLAVALDANAVPAATLVGTPLAVAAAYGVTRWWLTRRAVDRGRLDPGDDVAGVRRRALFARRARYAAYCTATGCAWAGLADMTGLDVSTPAGVGAWGLLAFAAAVAAVPWWRHIRHPPVPPPDPQPTVDSGPDLHPQAVVDAKDWAEHGLANSTVVVSSWEQVVGGRAFLIRSTKPGAVDGQKLAEHARLLAGVFGAPKAAINVVGDWDDDPNLSKVLIQPDTPLKEPQIWPGPDSVNIVTGDAVIGTYTDGGPVRDVIYLPGWGAPSRMIVGTKGSGKSELLRLLLTIQRYASYVDPAGVRRGAVASFLHDPKRGESFAPFRRAVHAFGTTLDDAHIMVDALIREMDRRYDFLAALEWVDGKGRAREGDVPWDVTVHGPLLSWTIDEAHELIRDKTFVAKLELLARKMRACAIEVNFATHLITLRDTGTSALRDMLTGGTAYIFRTTTRLNGSIGTGGQLAADPRALPKVPGLCYTMAGDQPGLLARTGYIPREQLYDYWYDDSNEPVGYPADLPVETLEAFGPDWVAWAEAGRQKGGRPPTGAWTRTQPATTGDAVEDGGEVHVAADGLMGILAAAHGPLKRETILAHPDWRWSNRTLGNELKKLRDSGAALRLAGGRYELTPQAAAVYMADLDARPVG